MKIRFLGTGYGECKLKKKALKDFRHKGGVLVDGKILFDATDDIFETAELLGFSDIFDSLEAVIISHSHEGHFSEEAITKLAMRKRIALYASDHVLSLVPDTENIEKIALMPFCPIEIGEYKLTPTPSNHETQNAGEECFNFIISKDKTVFYALDGGFLNYGAWILLSETKVDAVIAECALESQKPSAKSMVHNSIDAVNTVKEILTASGICSESTRFIVTHIPTDKKRPIHEELSAIAAEYGITVAYDGYFFSF